MTKFRWSTVFAAVLALVVGAGSLGAQVTTGSITGRVVDEAGAAIEGVQIQVQNSTTGFSRGSITNADGRYNIFGLEVGSGYSVTARRIGFQPVTKGGQNVTLGQTTRVDFTLSTQAAVLSAQTIVGELNPVITASKTGVGTTVSDSAIQRLPSLGRNFTDFVALTPQISNSGPGLSGGGSNNRYNNIQIDGSTETDLFGLGSTGQPGGQARGKSIGLEAVKQYQVLLSPFDVRYGNFAGALINAVTKSGTNELKGSAFYFWRDQSITRSQPYLNDFNQKQYGFSLGGPIIKDRLFFFVAPEIQEQTAPASGPYVGLAGATNLPSTADINRFNQIRSSYGLSNSTGGSRINENPLTNLFIRFDLQKLPFNSSLVVRHNYGKAQDDVFSRSFTGTTFPLLGNAYAFKSDKYASVIQLRSAFDNGMYNELFVSQNRIRDRRSPVTRNEPQITARASGFDIVDGSERFSHGNELDQDILEITDNLVIPKGTHKFTVGGTYQTYKARNLFAQSIFGVWQFNSLDDFQAGNTNQYIIGTPIGGDGSVRIESGLYGVYAQDEWSVTPKLSVQYGFRYDVPVFNDTPPTNQIVLQTFNRNTADVPSGNGTFSYRAGFNYDVTGDQKNQLRGGVGLFAGRPAYVWLANAFQNSGLAGAPILTCNTTNAPRFSAANAQTPPVTCVNGTTAALGAEINLLSKDLKFPQNLRASLGYDRDLGNGLIATFEALYTKGVNTLFYQNIALGDTLGRDRHGRLMYGTQPLSPNLRVPGRNTVLDVTNQSKDYAIQLTTGLQRRWRDNWEGSLFYTWSRSRDVQSLTSSTAFSQYRFGRPAGTQVQEATTLGTSIFEQPHRIVASGTYTFAKTKTDFSLTYFGESGQPFHYTYGGGSSGDLNGDGIGNDLMYIPRSTTNENEIIFVQNGTFTPAAQAAAFEKFIANNKCLNSQRGRIMERHSCREAWRNTFNTTVRQSLGGLGLGSALNTGLLDRLTLQWDVFNLANLINKDWGKQRNTGFGSVSILNYASKEAGSMVGPNGARARYTFNPATRFANDQNIVSNYRMQLSIRYAF